eukprot:7388993-Pyramimonas_sp.AAC.1
MELTRRVGGDREVLIDLLVVAFGGSCLERVWATCRPTLLEHPMGEMGHSLKTMCQRVSAWRGQMRLRLTRLQSIGRQNIQSHELGRLVV